MSIQTAPGSINHITNEKPKTKKDFVLLANNLRAYASQFPEESAPDAEKVTFNAGGFRVKCQPNLEAVRRLADKLSKGTKKLGTWTEPKLPCTKPYTETQKLNLAAKYKKEADNLRWGAGNTKSYYPNLNVKEQILKGYELEDFASQIEASIDRQEQAIAA